MMQEDLVRLEGPLTMATVPSRVREIQLAIAKAKVCVDFSGVGPIDSAVVALLAYLARLANGYPDKVRFDNLPKSVLECADIYGLENEFVSMMGKVLPSRRPGENRP